MVRAKMIRIKTEISLEEFLDLLAYEREIPDHYGDIIYSNSYVAVLIPDNNEIKAYVIPPQEYDTFIKDLENGPVTGDKFEVLEVSEEEVDPGQFDPLYPFLPKGGISPIQGTVAYKAPKILEGSAKYKAPEPSSGELNYKPGKLLYGSIKISTSGGG